RSAHDRLGARPRGRRAAGAAWADRLLPRLQALLPALVGARGGDPDLDAWPAGRRHRTGGDVDQVPLAASPHAITSGRRFGPVTMTSPDASCGSAPVQRMRKWWCTSVAPAEIIALTGQYFEADSSIARRTAASSTTVPCTMWVTSIRV